MRFTRKVALVSIALTAATELVIAIDWIMSHQKYEFATLQMGDKYYLQMYARRGVAEFSINEGWYPWCEEGAIDWNWDRGTFDPSDEIERAAFGLKIGFPVIGSSGYDTHVRAPHWIWMLLGGTLLMPAWLHLRLKRKLTESCMATGDNVSS